MTLNLFTKLNQTNNRIICVIFGSVSVIFNKTNKLKDLIVCLVFCSIVLGIFTFSIYSLLAVFVSLVDNRAHSFSPSSSALAASDMLCRDHVAQAFFCASTFAMQALLKILSSLLNESKKFVMLG